MLFCTWNFNWFSIFLVDFVKENIYYYSLQIILSGTLDVSEMDITEASFLWEVLSVKGIFMKQLGMDWAIRWTENWRPAFQLDFTVLCHLQLLNERVKWPSDSQLRKPEFPVLNVRTIPGLMQVWSVACGRVPFLENRLGGKGLCAECLSGINAREVKRKEGFSRGRRRTSKGSKSSVNPGRWDADRGAVASALIHHWVSATQGHLLYRLCFPTD